MTPEDYLMESEDETLRLEIKTDVEVVKKQALWAGLMPSMRVLDVGCGTGKTTSTLYEIITPSGEAIGIDDSLKRLDYAKTHYGKKGLDFYQRDILQPFDSIGKFDFIWVRFILEYFYDSSFEIVKNLSKILNPGGILCLVDLDHNSLNHFGIPIRLEKTIHEVMQIVKDEKNFDPYIGRKLYTYLYDLGLEDIQVNVSAHHLIYGDLKDTDSYNWLKKIEVVFKKIKYDFKEYEGGYEEFFEEFYTFFSHPRRFTYTPVISCRGIKPVTTNHTI